MFVSALMLNCLGQTALSMFHMWNVVTVSLNGTVNWIQILAIRQPVSWCSEILTREFIVIQESAVIDRPVRNPTEIWNDRHSLWEQTT